MKELICIVCPKGCHLKVDEEDNYKVMGHSCPRGEEYGRVELTHPARVLTSTVRCVGGAHPRCPVKTDGAIPKNLLRDAMRVLDGVELHVPIHAGDIVVENVCGTGINVVATKDEAGVL